MLGAHRVVTMLETSRVYASEVLAARPDRAAIEARHREWFRASAARARVIAERDPRRAQRELDRDRTNLQAVVRRGVEASAVADLEAALVVATALDEPRWQDGSLRIHEGTTTVLATLIEHPLFERVEPDTRVRALVAHARIATWRLDGGEVAARDLARAVEVAQRTGDPALRCLAHRFRALAELVRGAEREARVDAEAAIALARASGNPWLVCISEAMLAFVSRFQGQTRASRELLESARAGLRALGNDVFALSLGVDLVYVNLDLGDVHAASSIVERVERERQALGMHPLPRLAIARGHLALERGDAAAARDHYVAAGARARELGESVLELVATVCAAISGLELSCAGGARDAAARGDELDLREAIARMTKSGPHLYAGLGDAVAGVFHAILGDDATATEALDRASASTEGFGRVAYELCRAFVDERAVGDAATIVSSAVPHVGLAEIRLLTHILSRVGRRGASRSSRDERAFVLDRDGRWFVTPSGERVACGSRPVMRRILVALIDARLGGARPLPAEAIAEAGWPGERMLPAARRNRLHVMLTRIRDLGLRAAIEACDDGYALAPTVRIEGAPLLRLASAG
ncbi:MAG: hypothetical protein U0414_09660 [Polyangiaceae bacterium]